MAVVLQAVCTPGAHLRELANDTVALGADEALDGGIAEDGVRGGAHLHTAVGCSQDLLPAMTRQVLGHDHAVCTIRIDDLRSASLCWHTV